MHELLEIFKANQNLPGAPSWTDQQFLNECAEQQSIVSLNSTGKAEAFILFRKTSESLEISYLATLPEAKREGRMMDLLKRLAQDSTTLGLPIWLEVHESNSSAISLYEKFGFKLSGKRPNYYRDGGAALLYNYG